MKNTLVEIEDRINDVIYKIEACSILIDALGTRLNENNLPVDESELLAFTLISDILYEQKKILSQIIDSN